MKNPKNILMLILGLSLIVLLFTLGDFMALHDIKREYVSLSILEYLNIEIAANLPEWTSTKGEWGMVQVIFFLRFFFMSFNVVALILVIKQLYIKKNS